MKLKFILLTLFVVVAWRQPAFPENEEFLHPFIKDVQQVIQKYIQESLDVKQSDLFIEFSMIDTTYNSIKWDEIRILPGRRGAKKGVQMIKYGIFSKGEFRKDFSIKVRVKTIQDVVVTTQTAKRQHILGPDDVKLERRETTKVRGLVCTSIEDVLQLRTKRIVVGGEILIQSVLEDLPLIPNGARVTIQFKSSGVDVDMPGKAKQDGYLGKKVLVKCMANNRSYRAIVVDSKTVIVEI